MKKIILFGLVLILNALTLIENLSISSRILILDCKLIEIFLCLFVGIQFFLTYEFSFKFKKVFIFFLFVYIFTTVAEFGQLFKEGHQSFLLLFFSVMSGVGMLFSILAHHVKVYLLLRRT